MHFPQNACAWDFLAAVLLRSQTAQPASPSSSDPWNPIDLILPPGLHPSSWEGKPSVPSLSHLTLLSSDCDCGNSESLSGVPGTGDQRVLGWDREERLQLVPKLCASLGQERCLFQHLTLNSVWWLPGGRLQGCHLELGSGKDLCLMGL